MEPKDGGQSSAVGRVEHSSEFRYQVVSHYV